MKAVARRMRVLEDQHDLAGRQVAGVLHQLAGSASMFMIKRIMVFLLAGSDSATSRVNNAIAAKHPASTDRPEQFEDFLQVLAEFAHGLWTGYGVLSGLMASCM